MAEKNSDIKKVAKYTCTINVQLYWIFRWEIWFENNFIDFNKDDINIIYLKPTHAQLKHTLTHDAKNIKMFVSFLPYMFRSRY
jgi:hypothetical protein